MDVDQMERVYITAKLRDDRRMCRLRDEVYDRASAMHYYDKVSPHITVVPPFLYDKDRIDEVDGLVEDSGIVGEEVIFNNLMVWRNISDPEYIIMDTDVDMRDEQLQLVDSIRDAGGHYMKTPVSPHMTLFKSNRKWDHPPSVLKSGIQSCVGDYDDVDSTVISEVKAVSG